MKRRLNILITQRYVLAATMMRRRHGLHAKDIAVQNVETPLTLHDDVDWSELVNAIADATGQLGADRHTADLIIPSSWCYMCQLEQTEKRFNADAAAFEMEDYIPVPLERVTVAFDPRADMTLGVAVLTEPLAILLRQMEERGIRIDHVWVDVLMATASSRPAESSCVAVCDHGRLAVLNHTTGENSSAKVCNTLLGISTGSATDILARQPSHEHDRSQCAPTVFDLSTTPRSNHLQEVESGDTVPDGGHLGALDLMNVAAAEARMPDLRCGVLARANRFDGLYRHAVRAASLALVLMALLLVEGYRMRQDFANRIGAVRDEQQQIYRVIIPNGTLPPNPATRIASERKRIEALASTSSSDSAIPHMARAQPIDDVRVFVEALPPDIRILVNELVVDAGQFNLRGHTVSHRDAERIADAVATIDGVSVRPPRTSRLKKGGVEFSVRGKRSDTEDD